MTLKKSHWALDIGRDRRTRFILVDSVLSSWCEMSIRGPEKGRLLCMSCPKRTALEPLKKGRGESCYYGIKWYGPYHLIGCPCRLNSRGCKSKVLQ